MSLPNPVPSIVERPYWRALIRPVAYQPMRIPDPRECLNVLESIGISAGGWRYPFVDRQAARINLRKHHAEAFIDHYEYHEFSRMYRSGQYIYVHALREPDLPAVQQQLRRLEQLNRIPPGNATGAVLLVRLVRLVTASFVNAQNICETLDLDEPMHLDLRLGNVQGNVLIADENRSLDRYYQVADQIVDFDCTIEASSLRSEPLEHAIDKAKLFFAAFGWHSPTDFVLRGMQEEALK